MSTGFLPTLITTLAVIVSALPPAAADIYRQEREDGVILFTDIPTGEGFARVLREERNRGRGKSDREGATESVPRLPVPGVISSGYGLRTDPFDGRLSHHDGLDIATPYGVPVKPVDAGVVTFSGFRGGYGNMVIVRHPDGTSTLYAHTSRNLVTEGTPVGQETVIALTGSSGRSTGPHLHFEAWRGGVNITPQYRPDTGSGPPPRTVRSELSIRRTLMPDGSIVFSNLP